MITDFPTGSRTTYDSITTPKNALRRCYESTAIKFSLGGPGQILNTFKIWPQFFGSSRVAGITYDRPTTSYEWVRTFADWVTTNRWVRLKFCDFTTMCKNLMRLYYERCRSVTTKLWPHRTHPWIRRQIYWYWSLFTMWPTFFCVHGLRSFFWRQIKIGSSMKSSCSILRLYFYLSSPRPCLFLPFFIINKLPVIHTKS